MMRKILPTLSLLCVLTAAVAANDPAPAPLDLSLPDAMRLAMLKNLTVEGARLDAQSALEGYGSSWGQFDTVFFSNANYSNDTQAPTPTNLVGGVDVGASGPSETWFFNYQTGIRGTLLTGTTWQIDMSTQRVKNESVFFDPVTGPETNSSDIRTGDLNLSVTHPLLRDGADGYAKTALELAAKDAYIAAAAAATSNLATLESVIEAYWNLYFARQNVATKEESVGLAQELVDITTRKLEQGLETRIGQVEGEAELAQREEELLTAVNTKDDANDVLLRLVFAPDQLSEWNRNIIPVTVPEDEMILDRDQYTAIETAYRYRPDIMEARLRVERADVQVKRAENQVLPRLDLSGGYGRNSNQGSWEDTLKELDDKDFDGSNVALTLEMPIGNRTAGYELRRSRVERQSAGVDLRDTEMLTIQEVRSALRGVNLQEQRVITTGESRRLNQELYDGERRRLENDLSTPFQVRETLRNLLDAVDTELRAQLDLEVARARLLAAQGILPQYYGLVQDGAPELSTDQRPEAP